MVTVDFAWLGLFAACGLVAVVAASQFFGHVRVRMGAWLHPFDDYDRNLQVINAQFGFAWGGLTGRGWGLGRPGLTTFARSDFIAAALGEELGIAGLMGAGEREGWLEWLGD